MNPTRNTLLALLLTASLFTAAEAAEIDVPNDTPDINTALAMAGPGGKVIVDEGVYNQNVVFPFVNQTLESDGRVVIEGGGGLGIYVPPAATGASIEGFQVRNCSIGIYLRGNNARVEDCLVRLTSSIGILLVDSDHSTVAECKIKDTGSYGLLISSTDNSTIEECKIKRTGDIGMLVLGTLNSIMDCKVSDSAGVGIQVGTELTMASGILLDGNQVIRAGKDAIACSKLASNCTLQYNVTREAHFDGIDINALSDGHTLFKNKVYRSGNMGLELGGDGCTVTKNKAVQSSAQGIYVESVSNGGLYIKNKVKFSGGNGLFVWGTGNNFTQNKFMFNLGFDRFSGVALAANAWVANQYNTSNL